MNEVKILLDPEKLPNQWYNILPDLPKPLPPPKDPDEGPSRMPILPKIFPKEILRQEMCSDRYIPIPDELRELYLYIGRPTPLYRAKRLEEYLNTPAKIYFKREDLSPAGSHKGNTSIAQAYIAKKEGYEELTTETGAGQWGSALAFACCLNKLKCRVFMARASYLSKPYRRFLMEMWGAKVFPSPSDQTEFGRKMLAQDPNHSGSLGIAISEAIEVAVGNVGKTAYSIGSAFNHVILHQTIIGQEVLMQFEQIGQEPDIMIGCAGGGSNFSGFTYPTVGKQLREGGNKRFIAVGASEIPKFTRYTTNHSIYRYDFGETSKVTPMLKMFSLGSDFIPPAIYAGGLRYHGYAPTLCLLIAEGAIEGIDYPQDYAFQAAKIFAETEGLISAPETAHAIAAAIDEARKCKKTGEKKIIAFNYSGHGLLDLQGYADTILKEQEATAKAS